MKIIQKRIVSLLVSVALLFTLLPMSAMAEDALPIQDSGQPLSLSIGVSNISESSAEIAFAASMDGTIYYAVCRAYEQPPEEAVLLTKDTVMAKEGSAAAVVTELAAQTGYTAYALLEDTAGKCSTVATKEFTTEDEATMESEANSPTAAQSPTMAEPALLTPNAGYRAGEPVPYLDDKGAEQTCDVYTKLTAEYILSSSSTLTDGWYVVDSTFTYANRITISGDVHIILTDSANMTASKGITVEGSNSLTIYDQSGGTGKLTATGSKDGDAGIGGGESIAGGTITINGGTVTAKSGVQGAGIGGGDDGAGGNITINGGMVTATSNNFGAGIGGGLGGAGGTIVISGDAEVKATGGSGFSDSALALGGGAGIGSGGGISNYIHDGNSPASGSITISGNANVTAQGGGGNGSYTIKAHGGAGIGSGGAAGTGDSTGSVGTITIDNTAMISATGGLGNGANDGAKIGAGGSQSGVGKSYYTITIDNQPASNTIATQGSITESLNVVASASPSSALTYEWFSSSTNSNTGGVTTGVKTPSFPIPVTLALGNHYYYCVVSAMGADSVSSDVAKVSITAPTPQILPSGTVNIKGANFKVNMDDATSISYGGKKWCVIGANGEAGVATETGSMTLLAKDNFGLTRFCEEYPYDTNNYSAIISKNTPESALKAAIESSVTFTTAEDAVIKLVNLTGGTNATAQDGMYGDDIKDAKLWPLSVSEANAVNSELRKAAYYWWLRSPASRTYDAAIVISDGNVDSIGSPVGPSYDGGVRPALKLNLSSVLFASATGGPGAKSSVPANGVLSSNVAPSASLKLTVLDSKHIITSATTSDTITENSTISVSYEGASTGKALSAIVVKKADGAVTHYGKLAENISDPNGNASVTLPEGFDRNTMDLKLFTETINNDNLTDYASQPVGVTVGAPAPTNVTLNAVTANGSATQTTTQLTLTFDKDISGLTAEDINIVGATKGTLTKETGTGVYTLGISDIKVSDNKYVKVSVSKAGYAFTPTARTATVRVYTPPISYTIQVSASPVSYGSVTGGGSVTNGSSVTLKATANSGYRFVKWTENGTEVSTANPYTFTANANRTLVAVFEANSSGSEGNGGNGKGGGTITMPSTNVTIDKQPNMPTVAKVNISGTVKDGILFATITEQIVKDAIKAAQDAAKKSGKEADGIAVDFNVTGSGNYTSLNAAMDAGSIDRLKEAGVKFVKIGSTVLDITLDTGAIAELDSQSTGTVTVSAKKLTKLPDAAKKLIDNRPVFDITVSYKKNGKTELVSKFGKGIVTLGIAYQATGKENKGNLFGVYVDKNGKPQLLTNSSYDNTGRLIFSRNSLSTYGVGYKASAPNFTDTAKHWAKDNIDFVVSRGLITGSSESIFAPNTAITRADFLMALGRLSGADVSSYKSSSFTDVKNTDTAMPYIEWAVKNKIVSGYGNGKFGPNDSITREQMAVMMVNYAEATGYKLPVSRQSITFADDAKISAYAKAAVKAIQQTGVVGGKGNNLFDPQGNASRAEASTILRRFVELVIDEGTARGWVQNDAGQWQYIGENGKPAIGWISIENGKVYYFTKGGMEVCGKWLEIDSKWYYFYADGSLAKSTKVDGYEIGPDGVRKAK